MEVDFVPKTVSVSEGEGGVRTLAYSGRVPSEATSGIDRLRHNKKKNSN